MPERVVAGEYGISFATGAHRREKAKDNAAVPAIDDVFGRIELSTRAGDFPHALGFWFDVRAEHLHRLGTEHPVVGYRRGDDPTGAFGKRCHYHGAKRMALVRRYLHRAVQVRRFPDDQVHCSPLVAHGTRRHIVMQYRHIEGSTHRTEPCGSCLQIRSFRYKPYPRACVGEVCTVKAPDSRPGPSL